MNPNTNTLCECPGPRQLLQGVSDNVRNAFSLQRQKHRKCVEIPHAAQARAPACAHRLPAHAAPLYPTCLVLRGATPATRNTHSTGPDPTLLLWTSPRATFLPGGPITP